MVITAADADHPSFGCRDGAQWTYFGDAFFNTAMRRATNLRDAFNQARDIVRQRELRNGFDPSNPQMAGRREHRASAGGRCIDPAAADQREAAGPRPRDFGARRSAVICRRGGTGSANAWTDFLTNLTRCLGVAAMTAFALGAGASSAAAQAGSTRPTIAVLPLENNSGDASQDFFAEGMTDEIAVALTACEGLGVVARSSSFLLKPADRDIKTAGEKLNASYLVQGSARIVAERVRLNVRLVQAGDGVALWSQDYDAERGKIFDLEEEIAEKIAAALKVPASPGALVRSRTGDFDIYLDFLRAKVAARPRGAKPLAEPRRSWSGW